MLYISPIDIVAFTEDGVHSMAMDADVPTELPDHMIPALVALGARPYVAPSTKSKSKTTETASTESSANLEA